MSSRSYKISRFRPLVTGTLCIVALLLFFSLGRPPLAQAQAAADSSGCACHSAESDAWQISPHATAGENGQPVASCEGCHGPYVRGHPYDGVMRLSVDSVICRECHGGTFDEWEDSVHADAGVQCIGCHLSHSQTLRLTDQTLCLSCHQDALDDIFHISHRYGDVSCTECHPAPAADPGITTTSSGDTLVTIPAPIHDFADVSASNCVECHRKDVQTVTGVSLPTDDDGQMTLIELVATAEQVPELNAELETVQQLNRTLTGNAVTTLGLGIGVGGIFGIIFALTVGYVSQKGKGA